MTTRKLFWESLYNHFQSTVKSPKYAALAHVCEAINRAKERQDTLKEWRIAGQLAAAQAHYIPCHKSVLQLGLHLFYSHGFRVQPAEFKPKGGQVVDQRFIVETEAIKKEAIKSGALTESEILLVDESWQRIVKPPPGAGQVSLMFYDADEEEIVSASHP